MPDMKYSYQAQVLQPYAATVTPDTNLPTVGNGSRTGQMWRITLAGNMTINAPLTGPTDVGSRLLLEFIHDNTAGVYTITWNAVYKRAGGAFANTNAANAIDTIDFYWDGTYWVENARALNLS